MSDLLKICGLWRNERDGKVTLSGPLNPSVRIIITRNQFKRGDKDPDYVLYLAPAERKKSERRTDPEPPPPPGDEISF